MPSCRQDAGILDPNLCDRAMREPQPSVYMLSPYTNLPPTTVLTDPNLCDRARREPQPSVYMLSPYTNLPPTTVLTKKKVDKTKKKAKTTKLSPLNLGNNFAAENVSVDDVTITGVHQTDNYFNYETVDPDKKDASVKVSRDLSSNGARVFLTHIAAAAAGVLISTGAAVAAIPTTTVAIADVAVLTHLVAKNAVSSVFDGSARTKDQYQDDLNATLYEILLIEVNKLLRAGGNFALAAQPVYKHEPLLEEQWEGKPVYSMIRQGRSRPPPPLFSTIIVAAPSQHRHLLPCCPSFTAAPISDLKEEDVVVVRKIGYGMGYNAWENAATGCFVEKCSHI
nr:probable methyltransferase PMT11 [Tanacetum cinerariifolium]